MTQTSETTRYLELMASEGSAGYVLAVVKPPLEIEEDIEFFAQPTPTMLRAEIGSFKDGSQFFAYHQASIGTMDMERSLNSKSKEPMLREFGAKLMNGVQGVEFSGIIKTLSPEVEEKILRVQIARQPQISAFPD